MQDNIQDSCGNNNLNNAKKNRKDEFYTTWEVVEEEMNEYYEYNNNVFRDKTILCPCDDPSWSNFTKYFAKNFNRFGIKKLISTSYTKSAGSNNLISINNNSNELQNDRQGRIFILERDRDNTEINIDDIKYKYLNSDGDFKSDEVTMLRDEADIIVTNPPFSEFLNFLNWILEGGKQFIIIGNVNSATCKDVFPLIKNNKIWFGASIHSGDRKFYVPDDYPLNASGCGIDSEGHKYIRVKGVRWYTNIEHGKRHETIKYMSMSDNIKFNRKFINKCKKELDGEFYPEYENYKGVIEVPCSDAIPKECKKIMGVPVTFLDKYNPEQFEILGASEQCGRGLSNGLWDENNNIYHPLINGKKKYSRIFVRWRDKNE